MQQIAPGLSIRTLRRLQAVAEREQEDAQREVCGLIVSRDGVRIKLVYVPNEAANPGQWSIARHSYESVRQRATAQGMRVLGTFHSHPISEAIPGPRDIQTAQFGSLMLIYDVCGKQARLWKIQKVKGRPEATELTLNVLSR